MYDQTMCLGREYEKKKNGTKAGNGKKGQKKTAS